MLLQLPVFGRFAMYRNPHTRLPVPAMTLNDQKSMTLHFWPSVAYGLTLLLPGKSVPAMPLILKRCISRKPGNGFSPPSFEPSTPTSSCAEPTGVPVRADALFSLTLRSEYGQMMSVSGTCIS